VKKKVLLVEDDKYFNKVLFDRLSLEGFKVSSFLDGESAWEDLERARLAGEDYDVIVSDMLLPRLMGAELFTRIREAAHYDKLEIIAISGIYKDVAQIQEISGLHALKAYLTKPFDLQSFVQIVSQSEVVPFSIQAPLEDKTSSGDLSQCKAEMVFLKAYNDAFTGKIVFKGENHERVVYFANGFPVSVESSAVSESLGNSFVALSLIDRKTQEAASERMVIEGVQFGQMLLKMNILTKDELFQGIRKHTYRILLNTFLWREGIFERHSLNGLPEHVLPLEFNPILLMLKAQRSLFRDEFLISLYQTKNDFYPHRTERSVQILPLFNLDAESLLFLTNLPPGETLQNLLKTIPEPAHLMLFRVFYLLEALALLEWKLEPSSTAPRSVAHANFESEFRQNAPSDKGLRELQSEYMDMLGKNYFEVFDLPEDKSIKHEDLESAYRALRFRLHPDRFEASSSGQMQRILDDMLARIDKSYQTLSNGESRQEYLQSLRAQKQDSAADSKRFLEAQEIFREAQKAMSNHDFEGASKHYRAAFKTWSRNFEYELYAIFADFRSAQQKGDEVETQRLYLRLKAQSFEHRSHDLGFLLLGHASLSLNRNDQAKEAYQMALQNNEQNEEAARALATFGEEAFKKDRVGRAFQRSKVSIKHLLLWLAVAVFASGAIFLKDYLMSNRESGIVEVSAEDFNSIAPIISVRQKMHVAKMVLLEGKIQEMPAAVLSSKCAQLLAKGTRYGILEIYLFDDKIGLKGFCKGDKVRLY